MTEVKLSSADDKPQASNGARPVLITPFTSPQADFTINAGSTAWPAGDTITLPMKALTLSNVKAIPITGFADGATNQTFNWNVLNGTTPIVSQVAAPDSPPQPSRMAVAAGR